MMLMKNCSWMLLPTLLLYGCGSRSEPETERESTSATVSIKNVAPAVIIAGQSFYVNAKAGLSTLGVSGTSIKPNSRVRIGSQTLTTDVRKDGTFAIALVPQTILSTPGKYDVVVEQPDGSLSNVLVFTVLATTGPAPVIDQLFPASTIAGQGFNVQPSGGSALGIRGSNFRPDAKILFGSTELDTVFGGVNGLSAWVPPALFAAPGVTEVKVRNSDGKLSEPRPFKVTARP